MIGHHDQILATQFPPGAEKRRYLPFARLFAFDRIGDLDELHDLAVTHKAEVDVVGLILVRIDFDPSDAWRVHLSAGGHSNR